VPGSTRALNKEKLPEQTRSFKFSKPLSSLQRVVGREEAINFDARYYSFGCMSIMYQEQCQFLRFYKMKKQFKITKKVQQTLEILAPVEKRHGHIRHICNGEAGPHQVQEFRRSPKVNVLHQLEFYKRGILASAFQELWVGIHANNQGTSFRH